MRKAEISAEFTVHGSRGRLRASGFDDDVCYARRVIGATSRSRTSAACRRH
jgi:hypothetical protein